MEPVDGVVDLLIEQQQNVPQIQIRPDRRALARYGLLSVTCRNWWMWPLPGKWYPQIQEGDRMFDLLVRFDEDHRGSIEAIQNATFNLENGTIVPLAELATIQSRSGPNTISRENVQRAIVVSANVAGSDLRGTVDEIRSNVSANTSPYRRDTLWSMAGSLKVKPRQRISSCCSVSLPSSGFIFCSSLNLGR
jgi:copper/silver efflux system protein